jgi:hypothetical protein
MAVVRRLVHEPLEKHTHHTEVNGSYSIVTDKGERYLQVHTYGSDTRKIIGKKSQSIRFGPGAISQLKTLLAEQF